MTLLRLILRNLAYFRGVNAAVIAGVAVATAVLSGALMVGDSVRGSLVDLAVQRLGRIDHVVEMPRYVDASIVDRLRADPDVRDRFDIAPAILTRGAAARDPTRAGGDVARAAGLQIIGAAGWAAPAAAARGGVMLNGEAANALGGATPGADFVLSMPAASDAPRDASFARRARQDTLAGLRVRVRDVVAEPGMLTLFSPGGSQRSPLNAWVALPDLQDAVGQRGRVNLLLVDERGDAPDGAAVLAAALRRAMTLADAGLAIAPTPDGTEAALTSRFTYLDPAVEVAAERVAGAIGAPLRKVSVNLVNKVSRVAAEGRSGASLHYAVAAGVTPTEGGTLHDDEVALNQWAADRLDARVGDRLSLTFYRREAGGSLVEVTEADRGFAASLRVARILPMTGIGVDASLTPTYDGLTDADSVADWDPPEGFPIDQRLVTDADEQYWKQHKAAPKLFVSYANALRLWGNGDDRATSLRVPADRAQAFGDRLLAELDQAAAGLSVRALRQEQIAAATGTTDFGQLFVAFSFFLITAAALLVAMLMRLSVEQRARQLGALAAIGFAPSVLWRAMLAEGILLASVGGLIGSGLAVGYTWLMVTGLRTWWADAVGTTAMRLHVVPATLAIGFVAALLVAGGAILWAVRGVGRTVPARLLAGGWEAAAAMGRPSRLAPIVGFLALIVGVGTIAAGAAGGLGQQLAFMLGGTALLVAGLSFTWGGLRSASTCGRGGVVRSIPRLAARNATRHAARSVLCVALIALAAFAIIAVAAMRQGEPGDTGDLRSGAGGHHLIVEADIPLFGNPSTEAGRSLLGFRDPADAVWSRARFLALRERPGQDVSCQTLTRATDPSILGVPRELIERGGFRFASTIADAPNPWTLLEGPADGEAIPIIADANTAQYSLHVGIGDTIEVRDDAGRPQKLRLVATLAGSVFQGHLLMGDANFRAAFPSHSGFGVLLVDVDGADQDRVARVLGDELSEYAASVRTTASTLAGYLQVQNTYLSTFQLLGALGLMLGTIGLAVVLVRTVIERQSELALLASLGFGTWARMRVVLLESVFLLLAGLALGTACAVIGVFPALREPSRSINVASLSASLAGALLCGLLASGVAVLMVGRRVTARALRRE